MTASHRERNRLASVKLLKSIGYDACDVADPGTGLLELEEDTVVLDVVQRDVAGRVRFDGGCAVTRTVRVALPAEVAEEYRRATS